MLVMFFFFLFSPRVLPVPSTDCPETLLHVNVNINVNVNVIVVLNANVLRLDEDRRQRRSGISIWT